MIENTHKYRLIPYREVDQDSFGPQVRFYLGLVRKRSEYKIFGSNEEGIIILLPQYNGFQVRYIFVKEDCRRQGVCKALISHVLKYCIRYHKVLDVRVVFNNPVAEHIERYLLSLEMILLCTQKIFIITRANFEAAEGERWVNVRMMRIVDRFLRHGYCISSFSEAPKTVLDKLRNYFDQKIIPGWETPRDMHPFHHDYDSLKSFICWKDDEPVSYTCVERYGDSVVCSEHFCFRKYFALGVSILPLCYFVSAAFMDKSINRLSAMMLDGNLYAGKMLERDYSRFSPKITIQKEYAGNAKIPKKDVTCTDQTTL